MYRGSNSINNSRKCNTLWVGDLEPEVDEKYLRNVFGQEQNVKSIHIYKDKITNGKVNYAFLEFETPDIAEKVLHLYNGKEKPRFGKPFKINWGNQKSKRDRPTNLYGGNPPYGGNNRFQGMPGGFNGRMNPMMGMMGMRGMYPNNSMNPGMFPPPMMGMKNAPPPNRPGQDPNMFSIYIGELDTFCEQHNLVEFFKSKYKSVVGAKVIKDHITKKNKGFGFVHFEDGNEAEMAIKEMNGKVFMGKRIKTGRSFAKYQNMGMQPQRNSMYNMMGRGVPPMNMGRGMPHMNMGMGRPMMPYMRQPYMMGGQNMDPNQQNNVMHPKQRNSFNEQQNHGGERTANPVNSREIEHYRRNTKKVSPNKQPSYMISSKDKPSQRKERSNLKKVKRSEKISEVKTEQKFELKLIKEDDLDNETNKKIKPEEKEEKEVKEVKETKEKSSKKEEKDKSESESVSVSKKGKKENGSGKSNISKGLLNKRADMDKDPIDKNI